MSDTTEKLPRDVVFKMTITVNSHLGETDDEIRRRLVRQIYDIGDVDKIETEMDYMD